MTKAERQEARFLRDRKRRAEKRKKHVEQYCDWEKIASIEALQQSYRKARKGVRWKASTQSFELHLFFEILELHRKMTNDENVSRGYNHFEISERGKTRQIESCHISERVAQKAVADNCITPIFNPYLIQNNCASREGKGTSAAINYFRDDLVKAQRRFKGNFYIIQGDLSNYFGSIPHDKMINMLNEFITNEHIRIFYKRIIEAHEDVGIGLGSQLNQNFAGIYMNDVDHDITCQKYQKYYGRYNDDFYLMVATKQEAKEMLDYIKNKVEAKGLKLSDKKTRIVKSTHMITYLKQRFILLPEGRVIIKPNKDNSTRLRHKMKHLKSRMRRRKIKYTEICQSFKSSMGCFKDRNSYRTRQSLCEYYNNLYIKDWCHGQMA